ncbi:thioredoxin family protein [Chryseobacterium sp. PBS4-4]|uniref:Thioredoxin family protein n=1 Tax=Chryseobacterium edaphi TaxID=2976532 RepID=A0ABT2W609_9FLAO|nr:thioredoxin family protein [Chryseobacterium edaphi]MCU7617611.1 thioredoxin family protein [Chryseobacterium edaphi]
MKKLKAIFTALLIGFSIFNLNAQNTSQQESVKSSAESKGYKVGDAATDFRLKNIDGKIVSLKDFGDAKGFIVVFTCNHCPYAKSYEDRIVELDKIFKSQGYPVIAINPNDPKIQPQDGFKEMIERAGEKGFTFPYLFDEGQKIYPQYGATKTPHVFVLQKEGDKNIVKYIGAIDNNYENAAEATEHYVKDAVNSLIKGEPIETTKTVAIGCTIKVKK